MDRLIKIELKTKKRLGIFINSLNDGGAERVASILANQLIDDFEVTLILLDGVISYNLDTKIKIEVLFSDRSYLAKIREFILSPIKLYQVLRKNRIQTLLVFLYKPAFLSLFTKLIVRWPGAIIVSERTYTKSHYNAKTLYGRIGLKLIKLLYNKAEIIIPNSKLTAYCLKEEIGITVPIKVIYNPITSPKEPVENNLKKYQNIIEPIKILNVGNLYDYKNQEILLRALARLKIDKWQLNIVGSGPLKIKLLGICEELKISDKVTFNGKVDSYLFYPESDVFVSTSIIEGFPNALVEAMAHGLPVISTDCKSGPREILSPNSDFTFQLIETDEAEFAEYGILVPINNSGQLAKAINLLLNDLELINNYHKKSLMRASDFSFSQVIKQFKNVINDTIEK